MGDAARRGIAGLPSWPFRVVVDEHILLPSIGHMDQSQTPESALASNGPDVVDETISRRVTIEKRSESEVYVTET